MSIFDIKATYFDGTEDIESGTEVSSVVKTGETHSLTGLFIDAMVTETFADDSEYASGTITVSGTPLINVDATGTITVSGTPLGIVDNVDASGTITITGTPVAEETFVVGAQTFTFKESGTETGNVVINADNTTQATNIVTSITRDLTTVTATNEAGVVTVVSVAHGVAGNSIVLTENATGVAVSGTGTLAGGVDARAADTMVVGAQTFTFKVSGTSTGDIVIDGTPATQAANIVTSITRDLTTVTAARTDAVVTVTAAAHGAAGNSIVLTENATGIAVSGSGTLAGGVTADTIVVDDQTFTFVASGTSTGNIVQSAVNNTQAANILTAINRDLESVVATRSNAVVTVTAASVGEAGNLIVLTEDATGIAVSGSGTLEGGSSEAEGAGVTINLITSAVEAMSSPTTLMTATLALADLTEGARFDFPRVPQGDLGYTRLNAVVTGTMTAGHIKAALVGNMASESISPLNPPTGSRY